MTDDILSDVETTERLKAVVLDLYRQDVAGAIETLSKAPPEIMGAAALIMATEADEMGHSGLILSRLANTAPGGHGYNRLRVV